MVFIPYPRTDLNTHPDLLAWRKKANKRAGDWTDLKLFLADQPRLTAGIDRLPKCWYTELPQGDNYALDVEHFRPKKQAEPLTKERLDEIEKLVGYPVMQAMDSGAYSWLEFNYRNYRLTSALPNRGGAKHIYFPVVQNSKRLTDPNGPWQQSEYNLMLDPVDPFDDNLLLVLPNGHVIPKTPKTTITAAQLADLPAHWRTSGFNYMRAWVTIVMYRINDRILVEGREEVYKNTTETISYLVRCIEKNVDSIITSDYIKRITHSILPSAAFSLAARCALDAYTVSSADPLLKTTVEQQLKKIKTEIQTRSLLANHPIDWNNA